MKPSVSGGRDERGETDPTPEFHLRQDSANEFFNDGDHEAGSAQQQHETGKSRRFAFEMLGKGASRWEKDITVNHAGVRSVEEGCNAAQIQEANQADGDVCGPRGHLRERAVY